MTERKINEPNWELHKKKEIPGSEDELQKNLNDIRKRLSDKNNPPSKEFIVASMKFIKEIKNKKELYMKLGNAANEESRIESMKLDEEIRICDDIQQKMSDMKQLELKWHSKDEFRDGAKISTIKYFLVPEKDWENTLKYKIIAIKENLTGTPGTTVLWTTKEFRDIERLDQNLIDAKNNNFDRNPMIPDTGSLPKKWIVTWTQDWLSVSVWNQWHKADIRFWTVQQEDKLRSDDARKVWEVKWVRTGMSVEGENRWRFNLWMMWDISEVKTDYRLEASFRMLYAGAKQGTYIGVEKWSSLEKYIVAQWFKIPNWKILVTWALLDTLTKVDFSEVNMNRDVKMQQKAIWIDISQWFDKESIFNEIKWSVVYYDVGWKNLGKIWDIIKDTATEYDWTEISWWVRGWSKLLAEFVWTFKITPSFRADVAAWYERMDIEWMYDQGREVKHSPTAWAKLTFDVTDHDRIFGSYDYSQTSSVAKAWYAHNLWNNVETFVEWAYIQNTMWSQDEHRLTAWVRWSFESIWNAFGWKKQSKNSPLFSNQAQRDTLSLDDLEPNAKVTTDQIQVKVPVIFKEHKVYIDKTALPWASNIEKNENWTLKAINFDTWASNLTSINWMNHPEHQSFFSITWWKMLRVANFEKLHAPSVYKTVINEVGWNMTLFEFSTTAWSVELKLTPKNANGVPPDLAAKYMAWTLTIEQVKEQMIQLPAPNLSDLWITNNPKPTLNWTPVAWATAYAVSIDSWAPINVWNVTSFTPSANLSDWNHTFSIRSIKWTITWNDVKTATVTIDTQSTFTSLSFTKTFNSANIAISSTEAWTGYYILRPATEAAPTDSEVKAWNQIDLNVWSNNISLTWLTENTPYVFYFIAKDKVWSWNFQNAKSSLSLTTDIAPDTIAPNVLTFSANPSTPTSISFKTKIDENWLWYYVVMPKWAPAPTNIQIKSWIVQGKITSWNMSLTANIETSTTVNWLIWSAWYDIYFAAEDTAGNIQTANNWALSIDTLPTPDIISPIISWSISPTDTTALATINSNETWEIRYINQLSTLPPPSLETVKAGNQIAANAWSNNINIAWLTEQTWYTLYYAAKDAAWNWTILNNEAYITTATPDIISPIISWNISPTDTTALATINSNETWEIRYINQLSTLPPPSLETVKAGNQIAANAWSNNINIAWLTEQTWYTLYYAAKDTAWNWTILNNEAYITTAPPDIIEPMTLTFAITGTTSSSVGIELMLNENWTWYYAVVPAWSPAPSSAQIMNNSVQWSVSSWQIPLTAEVLNSAVATWLAWNTAYEIYTVSKDTAWNLQSIPDIWTFNTL